MDSFGAIGELPIAAIRESDSEGGPAAVANVLALTGTDGFAYLVELYPFQRPPE